MFKSWTLWIVGGLALLALAFFGGSTLLTSPSDPEPTPTATDSADPSGSSTEDDTSSSSQNEAPNDSRSSSTDDPSDGADTETNAEAPSESAIDLTVNGEPVPTSRVDQAFRSLLYRYQEAYRKEGRDFTQALQGPSGSYQEIQIRYQAAQSVIQQEVIDQEAERLGVQISDSTLQEAYEERFQTFLDENSITEDQLVELYQDSQKRTLTQRLLGVSDPSVEALKDRLRREVRYRLLADELAKRVLSDSADLSSDEAETEFNEWLSERIDESEIVYRQPLLRAHAMEKRISEAESLKEKQQRVQETIGAYQHAKETLDVDPASIDYIIGLLHNIRISVSQQRKEQLLDQAEATGSSDESSDDEVSQLDQQIQESRREATQLLSPLNVNSETQLLEMMKADSGNPLYKYMYAQYLFSNQDTNRAMRVIQMLERAIDLAPDYVDAHVLYGDVRMQQSYYADAIDHYRNALDSFDADIQAQLKTASRHVIRHKLAEASIARARSIDPQSAADQALQQRRRSLDQAEEHLNDLKANLGPPSRIYTDVLAGLGDVAMLRGDYQQAQSHYREALDVAVTADVQVKLGDAYRRNEQWREAERTYRQALETSTGFAPAHEGLAQLYQAQGETDRALEQFKKAFGSDRLFYGERRRIALEALEIDPNDVDMRLQLGNFYLDQNVYEGALKQYQAILDQSPDNVAAHIGVGRVHLGRLHYDKALSAFREALAADPTSGQRIEAYEWIVEAERGKVGPGAPLPESGREALWQLAQLYAETQQPNESFNRLLKLRENHPDFRPDAVQALMEETKATVGDDLPGTPTPNQGTELIEPGENHDPYATTPPTSGPHYVISADWGVHTDPIPNEVQVRNLAGGGVLIQYQPNASDEIRTRLRELVNEFRDSGTHCRVLLAPYEGLSSPIALTAWTRIDTLDDLDEARIRSFVSAHIGKGPEVGQVGCSLPGS